MCLWVCLSVYIYIRAHAPWLRVATYVYVSAHMSRMKYCFYTTFHQAKKTQDLHHSYKKLASTRIFKTWMLLKQLRKNNLRYQTVLKILFFKNVFSCFVFVFFFCGFFLCFFFFLIFKKTQNMHSYQQYVKQPEKKKQTNKQNSVYCSCRNWKIKFKRWKL